MRRRHGVLLAAAAALIVAAFLLDQPVARLMAGMPPAVVRLFTAVTWFGQGGVVLYPAAAIGLAALGAGWLSPGRRRDARAVALAAGAVFAVVAAAGLVNDALKIAFGRARPHLWLAGDDSGFHALRYGAKFASFPSGHTATSVAAAVILSALFPRARWFFVLFAVVIGLSRIVIDAHYLSDVLAGAAVGGGVARILLDRMTKSGWTPAWRDRNGGAA
jgi:undecaprenyl-diphosphatase